MLAKEPEECTRDQLPGEGKRRSPRVAPQLGTGWRGAGWEYHRTVDALEKPYCWEEEGDSECTRGHNSTYRKIKTHCRKISPYALQEIQKKITVQCVNAGGSGGRTVGWGVWRKKQPDTEDNFRDQRSPDTGVGVARSAEIPDGPDEIDAPRSAPALLSPPERPGKKSVRA